MNIIQKIKNVNKNKVNKKETFSKIPMERRELTLVELKALVWMIQVV
jgi:hypothetical protein